MKQLIIIATLSAMFLTSCMKDESVRPDDAENLIGFSSYMERSYTKTAVTDVTASNLDEFKVMSYIQGTDRVYFESEQTATKQEGGYYTTSETYFWPTTKHLDFFAYSGSGAGSITNTAGVASLKYTVPAAGDEDFVVAKAMDCSKDAATETSGKKAQPLTFSHALTKVNSVTLKAKADGIINTANYKFLFTDISIINAKNSATYTFNPASGDNWSSTATGTATYTFTEKAGNFLGSTTKTLKDGGVNDQFIILPQIATFSITYSIQYSPDGTDDNQVEVMSSTTKTVNVMMETGKAYDITFTLSNDAAPIVCIISGVDTWTSEYYPPHYIEKDGTDYGPGILFDTLFWAPVNCGTSSKHPDGLLYQFGRCDGQARDGEEGAPNSEDGTLALGPTSAPEAEKFYYGPGEWYRDWYENGPQTEWRMISPSLDGRGNPCPDGWRVPTLHEMGRMVYKNWDPSRYIGSGQRLVKSDEADSWVLDGSLIFRIYMDARRLDGVKVSGKINTYYWSSTIYPNKIEYGFTMVYANDGISTCGYPFAQGYYVRCVTSIYE